VLFTQQGLGVNFTAIERKITQPKCDVPVLFLRTFTQQKHTFGYKGLFCLFGALSDSNNNSLVIRSKREKTNYRFLFKVAKLMQEI
jgi:hypothetical protein